MSSRVLRIVGLAMTLSPIAVCFSRIIPAADFARSPTLSSADLSPDGKFMGYLFTRDGNAEMSFLDLATNKAIFAGMARSRFAGSHLHAGRFTWVSDDRVVFVTTSWGHFAMGLAAVNRDASGFKGLTGLTQIEGDAFSPTVPKVSDMITSVAIIHSSSHDPRSVLVLDYNTGVDKRTYYPDVLRLNTITGEHRLEVKNPGNVNHWLADWDGKVRFGLVQDGSKMRMVYRETESAPWTDFADFGTQHKDFNFAGFDGKNQVIYVTRPDANGHWTLYPYDVAKRKMGAPIFSHDTYDILPAELNPQYAGVPLAGMFFSERQRTLLGIHYLTEYPCVYWFDPAFASIQKQVDALHPDMVNDIVSTDYDEDRLLVLSWSAREPGIYSLVDLAKKSVTVIGRRMAWINPAEMAEMYPIELKARDGLDLHGYLTLPVGAAQKNLPMVMLVHGGPWARDAWGFDPVVQFLANRGYAVLQVNYRGSTGYGQSFLEKSDHEVGGKIQDDITDAVKWAIAKGIADPKRIAIMGASYGGYSTLFALAKTPELYRCGIDFAGVTDWPDLAKSQEKAEFRHAAAFWSEKIGDLNDPKGLQRLEQVSPINFAAEIKAPLLIVHGEEDQVVPTHQSRAMVTALKNAGRKPETFYIGPLGHAFPQDDDGAAFLTRLEKFLAANMALN